MVPCMSMSTGRTWALQPATYRGYLLFPVFYWSVFILISLEGIVYIFSIFALLDFCDRLLILPWFLIFPVENVLSIFNHMPDQGEKCLICLEPSAV